MYIQQNLKDKAFNLVRARIPSEYSSSVAINPYKSVQEILDHLKQYYALINEFGDAFTKITFMKQVKGQKFSEFYVDQQEYSYQYSFGEAQEVQLLLRALNVRYIRAVDNKNEYETISKLIARYEYVETTFSNITNSKTNKPSEGNKKDKSKKPKGPTKKLLDPYNKIYLQLDALEKKLKEGKRCFKDRKTSYAFF